MIDTKDHLDIINMHLEHLALATRELQKERAIKLNLTLYKLTEDNTIVPIPAAEYYLEKGI